MDDSKGRAFGAGKFVGTLPRFMARTGLVGAATIVGGLMIGSAPASAFTSSPLWTCRGSALSASVSGMNRVEPVVANGNPDTGGGASPNYAQCVNSDVGENNLATPVGLPANFLSAPTADASTTITPEIGPSIKQTFVAKGAVENLALNLGGPTTILGVTAANASVTGTCSANGTPTLTHQPGRRPDARWLADQPRPAPDRGLAAASAAERGHQHQGQRADPYGDRPHGQRPAHHDPQLGYERSGR
jgi:hypothetical protein